jgi:peptidoglycan/LPS O-acetylase OafA/YrhL
VPPSIAEALAGLKHVSTLPDQPSRWRRLVPIAWVTLMVVIAPMGALSGLRSFAPMLKADRADIMLWLTWLGETGPDAEFQDAEARAAAEQYVVARYGSVMASTEFWDQPYLQYGTFVEMRRLAETIVARHEPVSAEQVARARLLIARQIAESEESRAERPADPRSAAITVVSVIVTILLCFSLVLSLISSVIVPGGVVTRVLGLALVTSDGHEAGRVRSVARMLMAWSPAILWLAYLWFFGNPTPPTIVPVAVVVTILAVGALWTIARPQRGPHDRLSGTWVVTR